MIELNQLPDAGIQDLDERFKTSNGRLLSHFRRPSLSEAKTRELRGAIRSIGRCLKYGRQILKHCHPRMLIDSQAKKDDLRERFLALLEDDGFRCGHFLRNRRSSKGSAAILEDQRNHRGDTSMIQSIHLTNFKCFEQQEVVLQAAHSARWPQ